MIGLLLELWYFMNSVYEKWFLLRTFFLLRWFSTEKNIFRTLLCFEWESSSDILRFDFLLLTFPSEFLSVCICRDCSLSSKSTYVSEMFWSQDRVYLPSDKLSYYQKLYLRRHRCEKKRLIVQIHFVKIF